MKTKTITIYLTALLAAFISCGHVNGPSAVTGWSAISTGLPQNSTVKAIAADAGGSVWYAGTVDGVYKTTNGGAEWKAVNTGLDSRDISCLAVHPKNSAIIFAGTWGKGVYRTTTGGTDWTCVWRADMNPHVNDVAIGSDGRVWSATEQGLFVSSDNGENWTHTFNYGKVYTIAVHPQNPLRIYIGARWNGNFRSDDAGQSWQQINKGVYTDGQNIAAAYTFLFLPGNSSHILMSTDYNNLYESIDGGDAWQQAALASSEASVQKLSISALQNTQIWAATTVGGVFVTRDQGKSWQETAEGLNSAKVKTVYATAANPPTVLAGTVGNGIFQYSE
jgi:photosystem II stability/assembly factor-like uncharacterized protein